MFSAVYRTFRFRTAAPLATTRGIGCNDKIGEDKRVLLGAQAEIDSPRVTHRLGLKDEEIDSSPRGCCEEHLNAKAEETASAPADVRVRCYEYTERSLEINGKFQIAPRSS